MSPRTAPSAPPTDAKMWRRLLARVHPDGGGSHELFLFAVGLKEALDDAGTVDPGPGSRGAGPGPGGRRHSERIWYDECFGFEDDFWELTSRALSVGRSVEEPHRSILALLLDCGAVGHGRRAGRQTKGASYKQLSYICYLAGMNDQQKLRFVDICKSIPLSDQHAHHIITRLKRGAST